MCQTNASNTALGHTTIQKRSRFIGFIDEVGNTALSGIDPDFPLFVLCLVMVEREKYTERIIPLLSLLKLKYFDHEAIQLHSRDIRKAQGDFAVLQKEDIRKAFLEDLTAIMRDLPYTVFISAIRKEKLLKRYKDDAGNPYHIALEFLLERCAWFLERNHEFHLPIIAEARGKNEDEELQKVFNRIRDKGNYYNSAVRFQRINPVIQFRKKADNVAGLQLADLIGYPCARYILNPLKGNIPYVAVKEKICEQGGWKIFPV